MNYRNFFISAVALLCFVNIGFGKARLADDILGMNTYDKQMKPVTPDANGILYVDSSAVAGGDGSSWGEALRYLSDALIVANASTVVKEIHVAGGTYYPTGMQSGTDRDSTFLITRGGLKLFGGYPKGGGIRNMAANPTVLSGDIGTVNDAGDNSYHVMVMVGAINDADSLILDGFTLMKGNANGLFGEAYYYNGHRIHLCEGGGLVITNCPASIRNCTFTDNHTPSGWGAGIDLLYSDSIAITNCTFFGNQSNEGAGIYINYDIHIVITNSTFFGNQADGGAIHILGSDNSVVITSCIVYGNSLGIGYGLAFSGDVPVVTYSIVQGGYTGTGNSDQDPLFVDAANGDYRLQIGSPAINKGSNSAVPIGISTDLAGNPRIIDYTVDMGAFEYQQVLIRPDANGILYVDSSKTDSTSANGSSWPTALKSLAAALHVADSINTQATTTAGSVHQIWVAKGTYKPSYSVEDGHRGTDGGRNNAFLLPDSVKIYGGFAGTETSLEQRDSAKLFTANRTVLSGDLDNSGDISGGDACHVVVAVNIDSAMLDGFIVTGGNADNNALQQVFGQNVSSQDGGGLYIGYQSAPVLAHIRVMANAANSGGGLFNYQSSPVMTNSIISGNLADYGGGMENYDHSSPVLTNVVISGNRAYEQGGGMYNKTNASPTLVNVTFYGNKADDYGGALVNWTSSNPVLANCIIYGNSTGIQGNGQLKLTYSLVQGMSGGTDGNIDGNTDPLFVNAPDASTTPFTGGDYRLSRFSPLINKGNNDSLLHTFSSLPPSGGAGGGPGAGGGLDLAGNPRLVNGAVDMGAFENQQPITPDVSGILYVDSAAAADGNGSSWNKALKYLSAALVIANMNTAVKEIHIAKGTYYPTGEQSSSNRDSAFALLRGGLKLYGGFDPANGIKTLNDIRILPSFGGAGGGTILSGDIGGAGGRDDNSYHVMVIAGIPAGSDSLILDGFTITDGVANGANTQSYNGLVIERNYGGGMYIRMVADSVLWFNHCSFTDNQAKMSGGAMINKIASPALMNCILAGNQAGDKGGGMYNSTQSLPVLVNCTVSGNRAAQGGGMQNNNASARIINSIISGNSSGIENTGSESAPVIAYSLVQGLSGGADGNLDGNIIPHFVDAPDASSAPFAGGDYRLQLRSLLINKGNNDSLPVWDTTDLGGNTRISGSTVDMGAYEFQIVPVTPGPGNILYVDQNVSGSNGSGDSWANAVPELADALKWARQQYDADNNWLQNDSLRIFIARGVYHPLYNAADGSYTTDAARDNAFVMVKNVQLYGGFDPANGIKTLSDARILPSRGGTGEGSILSGDIGTSNNSTDNTYHVVISSGDAGSAGMNGLIISGGNADGSSYIKVNGSKLYRERGSGISNYSSSPNILNTVISNNSAENYGGGMANYKSSPKILNVIISNNSAENAGGGGIFNSISSPGIFNAKISNNSAKDGGGMYNDYSSPKLYNTTISNNSSANTGGGVYNYKSYPTIQNSIISDNSTVNSGGGIYSASSSLNILNTIISNNVAGSGGGIFTSSSSSTILNTTISNNSASYNGGGVYNNASSTTFNNTIIFGNKITDVVVSGIAHAANPKIPVFKFCLIGGATSWDADWGTDGGNNIATTTNPFADTANGDFSLIPGTAAVNGGSNTLYTGAGGDLANDTDLVGNPRVFNGTVDMGAYERLEKIPGAGNILYVDQNVSGGNGSGDSWANAIPELADALKWARQQHDADNDWLQNDSLRIFIARAVYHPLYNAADGSYTTDAARANAFVMVKNVQLYGGFDPANGIKTLSDARILPSRGGTGEGSILSGDIGTLNDSTDNAYHVVISAGDVGHAALNGLVISGGAMYGGSGVGFITVNGTEVSRFNGGGMYNNSSSPTLTNVTISGNFAGDYGGGMYNFSSSPILANVTISGNSAAGYGGGGGGMYNSNSSSPTLMNVTISGNYADQGGGMYNGQSSPTLTNVMILGNSAEDYGGGMFNGQSSPTLTNVVISGNSAALYGGGMYNGYSSPTLRNVTISGNSANHNGGGMFNDQSSPELYNTIVLGNSSGVYDGDNITYSNRGGIDAASANNLLQNDTTLATNLVFVNPVAPDNAPTTDGDYHLLPNPIVVNAGDNSLLPAEDTIDLDGNPRIVRDVVDLGAYEYHLFPDANGILYVDSAAAPGGDGSSWDKALSSFSHALTAAKNINAFATTAADSVRQIWVAKGTYQPEAGQSFAMLQHVKIYGGFAGTESSLAQRNLGSGDTSILKGNGNSVIRNDNNGLDTSAVLDGFKITGGSADYGGGMYNYYSSPTLRNVTISGNSVAFLGGGMYNYSSSSPTLRNVTISGNSAADGGGMFNASSSPTLRNVTISGNSAAVYGGGMYNDLSSPTLRNVMISGNSTTSHGGGMYNYNSSSPTLMNVTISGNSANLNGGGMYNYYSSPTLKNVTISGNSADDGGGMLNDQSSPKLFNTIVLGNSSGIYHANYRTYANQGGIDAASANNLLQNDTTLAANLVFVNPVAPGSAPTTDGDYHLLPNPIVVNAGDNSFLPANDTTDLAGNLRIIGDTVDLGAYEYIDSTKVTAQPVGVTTCAGEEAIFTVAAKGAGLSYRWEYTADSITWNEVTGGTTETLQLLNVQVSDSGKYYRVIVTGDRNADTSAAAMLSVRANPQITGQPKDSVVSYNGNAGFEVAASGYITGYQWQQSADDGQSWTDISGASNATYQLSNIKMDKDGLQFRVIVKGACHNDTSDVALLKVNPLVLALTPASPAPLFAAVPFSITFEATGGTAPYTYQLSGDALPASVQFVNGVLSGQFATPGDYSITIKATDNSTGVGTPFTVSRQYNLQVLNTGSCIAVSSWPSDQKVCEGGTVNFSVTGTGIDGYQWESRDIKSGSWQTVSGAAGATLTLNKLTVSQSGMQYRVKLSSNGCGTLTSQPVMLTVNAAKHTTLDKTICNGSVYNFGGEALSQSGTYKDTLASYTGCDSVVVLDLTVRPEIKTTLDKTICFGSVYNFGGETLSQSGTYKDTLASYTGCDSVVVLNLTVRPEIKTTLDKTICNGSVYNFGGEALSQSGTYKDTLASYTGCDSVVVLNLTVRPEIKTTLDKTICNGSVYNFGGEALSQSGTYKDTLASYTGCDSVVVLNLTVRPEIKTTLDKTICFGSVYNFGGKNISQSGTYKDTLTSYTGCDSVVVLNLTVRPEIKTTLDKTICNGSVYNFGGKNISQSGTYKDTLVSYTGCDSVVVLNLVVNANTSITTQPQDVTVKDGDDTRFSVTAEGTALQYQWQQWKDEGIWTNINNATADVLTVSDVTSAQNGTKYRVVITGACKSITSASATLTVSTVVLNITPATIPGGTSGAVYVPVQFSASGGSGSYTYAVTTGSLPQGISLSSDGLLSGTPVEDGSFTFTVAVTDNSNNTGTRSYTLDICGQAAIIMEPEDKTVCENSHTSFSVSATGTNLSYQWQSSTATDMEGTTWDNIAGGTTATLNISNAKLADNGTEYRVIVSSGCGSVTSAPATLTVNTATAISVQPTDRVVADGGNAIFSVSTTGAAQAYQWQWSADNGVTWSNVDGATTESLSLNSVTNADNGKLYRVVITGSCGTVVSDAAMLSVNNSLLTIAPSSLADAGVGNTYHVSFTASGGTMPYTYTETGTLPPGISLDAGGTLSGTPLKAGNYSFVLRVKDQAGNTYSSGYMLDVICTAPVISELNQSICEGGTYQFGGKNISKEGTYYDTLTAASGCDSVVVLHLSVNAKTVILAQPVSKTICASASGESDATFSVNATGTNLSYQWQSSSDGIAWHNETTGTTLQLSNVEASDNGTKYRVVITGACGNVTSAAATLTVQADTKIVTQPTNKIVCEGEQVKWMVKATGTDLSYQWQRSSDGSTWNNVANATAPTLDLSDIGLNESGTKYRVVVNGACDKVISDEAVLTVRDETAITAQPEGVTVCANSNAAFHVAATGTDLIYQWQFSTDGAAWENMNGETSETLKLANVGTSQTGTQYRVRVTGACKAVTSDAVTLTVNPLPAIAIVADSTNPVSKGWPVHLTASGAQQYHWNNHLDIQSGWNEAVLTIRPQKDATYTVTGTSAASCTATQNYSVTVMTDYNLICNNIVSPDGDGKNETWVIQNISSYPHNELMIFDRTGRVIFHKRGYNNRWDGRIRGGDLHEGTYYYVFIVDGGKKVFKGFIELLNGKR